MTDTFNAIVAEEIDGKPRASLKQIQLKDLPDEDVLVEVACSTLNYKDGLAVSGKGRICHNWRNRFLREASAGAWLSTSRLDPVSLTLFHSVPVAAGFRECIQYRREILSWNRSAPNAKTRQGTARTRWLLVNHSAMPMHAKSPMLVADQT